MGSPVDIDFQIAIFEQGLLDEIEGAVYTLTEIARSKKEKVDFKYVTISLVNRYVSIKTEDTKAYAGNFGKQPKQGQYQNNSGNKNQSNNNEKCTFCNCNYNIKDCWHVYPKDALEGFTPKTKKELEARKKYYQGK